MGAIDLGRFLQRYKPDTSLGAPRTQAAKAGSPQDAPAGVDVTVAEVLSQIGGMSFNNGLYRTHRLEDVPAWNKTIATAWNETAGKVTVFAYDWGGAQYALYKQDTVFQFSAGDLEFVNIPADVASFHNEILMEHPSEAAAAEFYKAWLESGGAVPRYDTCIGYQKPLFLGGTDWIENLELIDLDVYWTVTAPIIARARKVGVGGKIGKIEIGE
mgnify:CR=1 FL=1